MGRSSVGKLRWITFEINFTLLGGVSMKKYIKPTIEAVELRPEERMALCLTSESPSYRVVGCGFEVTTLTQHSS